ncbi:FAD binding domain protein, partial [Vibrio parahaemolyticus V-223/04]
ESMKMQKERLLSRAVP